MSTTSSDPPSKEPQTKSQAQCLEKNDGVLDGLDVTGSLSDSHRDYLEQRHGTVNLDPIPSMDPADPYNWPSWKVRTNDPCIHP